MKILLLHQYYLEKDAPGGSRWNEMTRMWADEGHEITVLCGMVNYVTGKIPEQYRGRRFHRSWYAERLEVVRCFVSEQYNASFRGRLWGYFSFVFSSLWAGLFKCRGPYDVIVVSSPPLFVGITAYILSVLKRTPFVFEVRDLWPESAIDTGVVRNRWIIRMAYALERFIYRKARLINVLTPAFRDKLVQEKQVPSEKVILIPNAADFSLSEPLGNRFDLAAFRAAQGWTGKTVITYVGAHGVANHLVQVLDTADLLREQPEVLFVLIGDGMQKAALMEDAQRRGLQNVQFVDPVPKAEVFQYILASDFGASILKKTDTFKSVYSNKTFDYMACRKPVLLLIDGVSRQLVEEARCGTFVEPENPEAFAAAIRGYLQRGEEVWKQEGESGYAYARAHFDREVLAARYLQHLKTSVSK